MKKISVVLFTIIIATGVNAQNKVAEIPIPESVTLDASLNKSKAEIIKKTALAYYAFWNTGKQEYLDQAVSPAFIDNTLPAGRPQGPTGPLFASKNFRAAVPNLKCNVKDLVISGDKVTVRMEFTGNFTGTFLNKNGNSNPIHFMAIDILHIVNGKIIEDWHLEDNLTLMEQFGIIKL